MSFIYHVRGPRLKVKILDSMDHKSSGGIILSATVEKESIEIGEVLEIGDGAYMDIGDNSPWCKIGDKVLFQRYAGKNIEEGTSVIRFLKDIDIIAVVEEK